MAPVSMTGFADAQGAFETLHWRWEVRSVNGRSLDIRLRLPPGLESIEAAARVLAGERFRRGNIQATLTLESRDGSRGLKVDPAALAQAVKIAREVANETGFAPARVDGLLALKGVIVQDDALGADTATRAVRDAAVLETLSLALDSLARSRRSEGLKLGAVLERTADEIGRLTEAAARIAASQPAAIRERVQMQLKDLLDQSMPGDERVAQEIALLAARADVREEIERLRAHVQEARQLIASEEAVGRKLDFLSQELNREANTLCSKSADILLTRIGLALKAAIDQFREQAQNLE
ncbi:MAG TPA: YicC/YloC family endoribonuclease [Rhizomicrobium sp.]|nr:YicC/YloC family endoribonuclease [Rhizomicrobium sp.]